MNIGVLAGLAAGAIWGLSFIAPLGVAPYQPVDLVIGRTIVFGLVSLAFLARNGFADIKALSRPMLLTVFLLALTGFNLSFALIAQAISLIGPAIVALIIGALPVAMAIGGNRGADRVPFSRLIGPLIAITLGLIIVNADKFAATLPGDRLSTLVGLALAIAGFWSWYWYGMRNAEVLRRGEIKADPVTWTALTGVGALASVPLLVAAALVFDMSAVPALGLAHPEVGGLIFWSLAIGLASSVLATVLWSVASKRLPVSLAAQLIVSETLFALAYGYILSGKGPSIAEAIAATLIIGGVVAAIRAFQR